MKVFKKCQIIIIIIIPDRSWACERVEAFELTPIKIYCQWLHSSFNCVLGIIYPLIAPCKINQ